MRMASLLDGGLTSDVNLIWPALSVATAKPHQTALLASCLETYNIISDVLPAEENLQISTYYTVVRSSLISANLIVTSSRQSILSLPSDYNQSRFSTFYDDFTQLASDWLS